MSHVTSYATVDKDYETEKHVYVATITQTPNTFNIIYEVSTLNLCFCFILILAPKTLYLLVILYTTISIVGQI